MSNFAHEVLKRHHQLEREARKAAFAEIEFAARAAKRADETIEQTIARLHAESHPSILKFYNMEQQQ